MSADSLGLQKVNGIFPVEMQSMLLSDNFNTTELVKDAMVFQQQKLQSEKVVIETEEIIEHSFEFVSSSEKTKDEKTVEKIRNEMICNVFGIRSFKKLEKYQFDYANMDNMEDMPSVGEVLEDSRNVARGQRGANARSRKDMRNDAIKTSFAVGGLMLPYLTSKFAALGVLVAKVSAIITLPAVAIGMAVSGLLWGYKKYRKAKVGNLADANEKQRNYIAKLGNFMQEAVQYSEMVEKDSELILEKKKTMKKKDFKKWCDEYSKEKYEELKAKTEENTI